RQQLLGNCLFPPDLFRDIDAAASDLIASAKAGDLSELRRAVARPRRKGPRSEIGKAACAETIATFTAHLTANKKPDWHGVAIILGCQGGDVGRQGLAYEAESLRSLVNRYRAARGAYEFPAQKPKFVRAKNLA